uniref:Uncharacterized protein n=1 Tax=Rhizophora mucronata TaxID=61149 RepID=A0A2P2ILC9_RHIMU
MLFMAITRRAKEKNSLNEWLGKQNIQVYPLVSHRSIPLYFHFI